MPYRRPTLSDIDARLRAAVESRLPGVDPALRRSLIGAITRSVAGAHHEMYGYLAWIAEQAFPDRASSVELARWAAIWGIERVAPATATGTLYVGGTLGAAIPSGTLWRRPDGVEYRSTELALIVSPGAATVSVTAVAPGATGNAVMDTPVTLLSPLAGIVSGGHVIEVAGGADSESDESLRTRLLARLRARPQGGSADDYVQWARAAHPDVTRAWAHAHTPAPGDVTVYPMTDTATADGIPDAHIVAAVTTYIAAHRPVTAAVTVLAPTPDPLDVTISGITPDSAAVRAEVEAEIADMIRRDSRPGGTILVSRLREAISGAAGETDHVLVAPVADVTHTAGQIAVPGTVTWQ